VRAVPAQGGKTAVSGDAPTSFHLGAGESVARARPLSDAATSSAGRINRGVLRGAGISPPKSVPQHPAARQTLVLVDVANPGRRWRDPNTLESRHRAESAAAFAPPAGPPDLSAPAGAAAAASAGAGAAGAARPRSSSFLARNGGATRYLSNGVSNRAVTPALSAHQRLSSLEDSLAQTGTQLWTTGPAGYVRGSAAEASSGQSGWSAAADDAELNDGRWPMPSRPPSGAAHSGLPRTSAAGQGYAFTTGQIARRPATARFSALDRDAAPLELAGGLGAGAGGVIDLSATRAVGWAPGAPSEAAADAPSASAAALAAAAATALQRERAPPTLFDLPPPVPLLRSKADAETFISRASRRGVNPRTRASNLDASLGALVAANAAAAAHLMGHALPGSRLGLAGTSAAIAAASVRLPAAAGAAGSAFASSQTLQQQMLEESGLQEQQQHLQMQMQMQMQAQHDGSQGGGGSRAEDDFGDGYPGGSQQQQHEQQQRGGELPAPAPTTYGSSGRGQAVGGGFRSVLSGAAGPASAANDVPRRTTSHMGGESWTSRESYTLVALPRSEEMLRAGAMQARFTQRLEPHHEKDLTHGFVDAGLWNEMNLLGNTKSPVRRPLTAQPLPTAELHGRGAALARAFPPQREHAVEHAHYGYGAPAAAGVLLDGKVPPFGALLNERAGRLRAAHEQLGGAQLEALRLGSSLAATAVRSTSPGAAARAASAAAAGGFPLSPRATMREAEAESRRHLPPHPESAALDAFDAKHSVRDPSHWPVKVLRAKIRESGVADRVGMAPAEALQRASRAQLLAAWERVPAARRILELYGNAGLMNASHPLSQGGVFTESSSSLHGAIGLPTNVISGRTNALQHAVGAEEGRWSRL